MAKRSRIETRSKTRIKDRWICVYRSHVYDSTKPRIAWQTHPHSKYGRISRFISIFLGSLVPLSIAVAKLEIVNKIDVLSIVVTASLLGTISLFFFIALTWTLAVAAAVKIERRTLSEYLEFGTVLSPGTFALIVALVYNAPYSFLEVQTIIGGG